LKKSVKGALPPPPSITHTHSRALLLSSSQATMRSVTLEEARASPATRGAAAALDQGRLDTETRMWAQRVLGTGMGHLEANTPSMGGDRVRVAVTSTSEGAARRLAWTTSRRARRAG
jgi:hypothetical protein